ncbi:MAG: hypothetical protein OXF88_12330 [Rhodobacteraceae bacterium]|nr:hypothetical protein [Paracoccaceae bacterium]MCY4140043.1 hypothetical protein [Paracoccaceae bacterium]
MRRLIHPVIGAVVWTAPVLAEDWDPTITVGERYALGQHGWNEHGRYWENFDDAQLWEKLPPPELPDAHG